MTSLRAVFPLSQAFLPGEWVSLRVFEERYLRMVEDNRNGSMQLCTVLIERGSEVGGGDVRLPHGVVLEIEQLTENGTGFHLGCRASQIVSVVEWLDNDVYPTAMTTMQTVEPLGHEETAHAAERLTATIEKCRLLISSLDVTPGASHQALTFLDTLSEAVTESRSTTNREAVLWQAFWQVARMVPCGALDRYSLLGPGSLIDRTERLRSIADHVSDVIRFGSL